MSSFSYTFNKVYFVETGESKYVNTGKLFTEKESFE